MPELRGGFKMTKKLGPVQLVMTIADCGDCPFVDMDVDYSRCDTGGFSLPIYRREGQIITPPAKCPLRQKVN